MSLMANVFEANVKFDKSVADFDFFEVEGIESISKRYESLGIVVSHLQRKERKPFATYTPSETKNYVIGFLPNGPEKKQFDIEGLRVRYLGKQELPPSSPAYRTLTELLNKSKSWELKVDMWSLGTPHTFYPKRWRDLNKDYPNCGLWLFRGPYFRYNVLSDGRITLTIDSKTHYVKSETFLEEINRRGKDLKWFKNELKAKEEFYKRLRRKFWGIHFYYTLAQQDIAINDIDARPLSKIPLKEEVEVGGKLCKTVLEFLKAKYGHDPLVRAIDETQPGLKSNDLTFAPQFLHKSVDLEEVDDLILNEQTFYMDTRGLKGRKDIDRPARLRWDFITKYLQRYLTYVDVGPFFAKFSEPMKFPLTNHFDKPRLLVRQEGEPVIFEDLPMALAKGPYKDPKISSVYFYSALEGEEAIYDKQFYGALRDFAKRRFGASFPTSMLLLDKDLNSVRTYLKKSQEKYRKLSGVCLAIVKEDSPLHDELIRMFGEYELPVQCVTSKTAIEDVCFSRNVYITENICAMMIAKAGGIPWVLYDELNYGCYGAIDIGRTKAEYWAMAVVYNRKGMFETLPGRITIGEGLDVQSIRYCVEEAARYASDSSDFIFFRHGRIYPNELVAFENVTRESPFKNCAIVSIKTEEVPYRIFREVNGKVIKPLSG